jgi:hypothetical protein
MASTYSNLKIELIGTGDQSGTWGVTTNTNLGTAIEEAITGSADVTFASADVTLTLTNTNATQTARNLRLNLVGTVGAAQNLIVPAIEKQYIVNNTLGYDITVKNSTGTGVAVPAGKSMIVFNTGSNVVDVISALGSGTVLPVANGGTGVTTSTGSGNTVLSASPTFTGAPLAPTAAPGTNTTQIATTAFVGAAVTAATGSLGTMSSQNANAVAITGGTMSGVGITGGSMASVNITSGTITGITDLAVADGGTGASSITANSVILGNGSGALSGNLVAPGTSGNVLISNGTTWTSGAPAISSWNVQNVNTVVASGATGSYSIPSNCIMVMGTNYHSMGSNVGSRVSVNIKNSSGTTLFTYALTGGNENNGTDGGSGMSTRSAWTVPIPAAAAGGSLQFFRSSGSSNSWNVTVNQYVASA